MENRVGEFSADETDNEVRVCVIEASQQQGGSEGEAKFLEGDDALQPRLPVALVSRFSLLHTGLEG